MTHNGNFQLLFHDHVSHYLSPMTNESLCEIEDIGNLFECQSSRLFMASQQGIPMDNITRQPQPQGKVFIQRDYSEGTGVRFQTKLPQELIERIDQSRFEFTINKLNEFYAEAERLGARTYCESCLACLTAFTVLVCMTTHYDKCVKKAGLFIQQQNDEIYAPRGLVITDPFTRGLRVIEISVYPTGT